MTADFLAGIGRTLIIEFVPPTDSQVVGMLSRMAPGGARVFSRPVRAGLSRALPDTRSGVDSRHRTAVVPNGVAEGPVMAGLRARASWFVLTLPLAAGCALLYMASEWLFIVTRPSALGSMPLSVELEPPSRGRPVPLMIPLLGTQLVASMLSMVAFPRFRALAVVPSAIVGGGLAAPAGRQLHLHRLRLRRADQRRSGSRALRSCRAGDDRRGGRADAPPGRECLAGPSLAPRPFGCPYRWHCHKASRCGRCRRASPTSPSLRRIEGSSRATRPNILILGIDGVDADVPLGLRIRAGYIAIPCRNCATRACSSRMRSRTLAERTARWSPCLTGRLPFSTHVTFPPHLAPERRCASPSAGAAETEGLHEPAARHAALCRRRGREPSRLRRGELPLAGSRSH